MKKAILFISHDASRTGAPIVLYNFLKWLKVNTQIDFSILLVKGGELEDSFLKLAPTFLLNWDDIVAIREHRLSYRILRKLRVNQSLCYQILRWLGFPDYCLMSDLLKRHYQHHDISLIYSNTAVNGLIIDSLKSFLSCPVISHIHELEFVINTCAKKDFDFVLKHTDHFIVCAEVVKKNLINNYDVLENKISTVYEFIPVSHSIQKSNLIHRELYLPGNAFIVGASGTICWRKGSDLFVQLARAVFNQIPDSLIYFIWLGMDSLNMVPKLRYDLKKLGLDNRVYFIGARDNPIDYFASYDVFVLLSREDPFPLVCLENASVGNPIICFDQSGGISEFVDSDCGVVVPYLNIQAAADAVVSLHNSPQLRYDLGFRGYIKVRESHSIQHQAHQITDLIRRVSHGVH